MQSIQSLFDRVGAVVAIAAISVTGFACGSADDNGDEAEIEGTYVHAEEGTVVLEPGGEGTITQSADPTPFEWQRDGDTIEITIDGDVAAEATLDGDELTFSPGAFSGDQAVTFTRT